MRSFIRTFRVLAIAATLLLAGCSAAGVTPAPAPSPTSAPATSPSAGDPSSAIASPTPTPVATTDGQGDELVVGSLSIALKTGYTASRFTRRWRTTDVDVTEDRGGVLSITSLMNDARVTGEASFAFSADVYTKVGSEWGTFRLENAGGAWEGPCSGGAWDDGNATMWSCWLVGSGAYDGYTYYFQFVGSEDGTVSPSLEGIIYPGSPPKP